MGFADVTVRELASDYALELEAVLALCQKLGIPHHDADSFLALEDAKRILTAVQAPSPTDPQADTP
ncbi:MAG: translation initiation factor IF-2 [Synechococcaceae cyanobacterium SM2_3_60]|nr:translation initiation factor IF-2 [Synechococcaceae cyanobacterium SM2_3_60]